MYLPDAWCKHLYYVHTGTRIGPVRHRIHETEVTDCCEPLDILFLICIIALLLNKVFFLLCRRREGGKKKKSKKYLQATTPVMSHSGFVQGRNPIMDTWVASVVKPLLGVFTNALFPFVPVDLTFWWGWCLPACRPSILKVNLHHPQLSPTAEDLLTPKWCLILALTSPETHPPLVPECV